jgi:uncharacterized protein (TIGR00297 family)
VRRYRSHTPRSPLVTMSLMPANLVIGLCLAALISTGAAAAGALTIRAAFASTVVGTLVFAAGGVGWSIPLLTFFVNSSLLSRHRSGSISKPAREDPPRRTARQVLANGFMPGLWAGCHLVLPADAWAIPFASALATAAADTWATEIGRRSSSSPRDVLTGRQVPHGSSGGITLQGLVASLAGSTTVTVACLATGIIGPVGAAAVAMAGFGGSLVDSLLGSALQERRWCPMCREETEHALHLRCSTPTSYLRGLAGFDNDWVNLSAGACGSLLGVVFTYLV